MKQRWHIYILPENSETEMAYLHKWRTQCRELPLCAGSGEGCQWQALPSPVQCEETTTRTRDLPVTGGKTLPLAPGLLFRWHIYILLENRMIENRICTSTECQSKKAGYPVTELVEYISYGLAAVTWILSSWHVWQTKKTSGMASSECIHKKATKTGFYTGALAISNDVTALFGTCHNNQYQTFFQR